MVGFWVKRSANGISRCVRGGIICRIFGLEICSSRRPPKRPSPVRLVLPDTRGMPCSFAIFAVAGSSVASLAMSSKAESSGRASCYGRKFAGALLALPIGMMPWSGNGF